MKLTITIDLSAPGFAHRPLEAARDLIAQNFKRVIAEDMLDGKLGGAWAMLDVQGYVVGTCVIADAGLYEETPALAVESTPVEATPTPEAKVSGKKK